MPMTSHNASPLIRLKVWLTQFPYANSSERHQAFLVQNLLLALLVIAFFGAFVALLAPVALGDALLVVALVWLNIPVALTGIWLLHRGCFAQSAMFTCVGLILTMSLLLITTGVRDGGALLFGFSLPILLAGLLAGRFTLLLAIVLSSAGIVLAFIMERLQMPLAGIAAPQGENMGGILGGFLVVALILGFFVLRFGQVLRTALVETQQRATELEEAQVHLEQRVVERTTALETALTAVQNQAAVQAQLLAENRAQRSLIQQLSVPLLPISRTTLVVPLVGDFDHERITALQQRVLQRLERAKVRRILLDVSGVALLDQPVAQGLLDLVAQVRLLGAQAVLVGVRPEVAEALVALNSDLAAMRTFADLEAALGDV
ncbi:MAG: STAS domain-containing protein [Candidatus Viridilinea halotolerans]|uniref:STAS domain-containing protein n=1 Tax=Candidatus Viridilinea halotolerans TaxID=2491704 RepID=A0A426TT68_9CHLR|nr:MAG: STAS domain-containing protein [Candidatus Viridilinea halotolerans]